MIEQSFTFQNLSKPPNKEIIAQSAGHELTQLNPLAVEICMRKDGIKLKHMITREG